MPASSPQDTFTSIEIGTDTIKVVVARAVGDNAFKVIGAGEAKSFKVVKGEIQNALFVGEQLEKAIQDADRSMDEGDLYESFVGLTLSGNYITTNTLNSTVNIDTPGHTVTAEHVRQAIRNAGLMDTSSQVDVLSTSVKYHVLNDGRQFLNPIGMTATSLQTFIQIVQARKERYATPIKLANRILGRDLNFCGYTPLSIGKACLPKSSVRHSGQLVIDIGAGVTSYALFTSAGCHTAGQITVGSEQGANDLHIAFQIPPAHARNILGNFGRLKCSLNPRLPYNASCIEVEQGAGAAPQRVLAKNVETIVRLRFLELFQIIREKLLAENALQWLNNGEILLSGGTATLPGMAELAGSVFLNSVRLAEPYGFSGPQNIIGNPAYLAVLGNIRDSKEKLDIYQQQNEPREHAPSGARTLWNAIKSIVNF